jgi:hypothetical protein
VTVTPPPPPNTASKWVLPPELLYKVIAGKSPSLGFGLTDIDQYLFTIEIVLGKAESFINVVIKT